MYVFHPSGFAIQYLHDQSPPSGPGIRDPPQPRHDVPANDPPIRRRKYVAVNPVHDTAMLGDEIAEVLQARIPLEHARGQVPDQPEQGQEDPVHRTDDRPMRPLLNPGPERRKRRANDAPSDDALDGLVRARLAGGGADGAELRPAEPPTGEVPPHVAECDAQPRPEDEVRAYGDREAYSLGEEGRDAAVLAEAIEDRPNERGEAGGFHDVRPHLPYAAPTILRGRAKSNSM
jgi:hypothetical protein